VTLQWGNGKYVKTIPLGLKDNVATLYSSPGYDKFHAFCAEAGLETMTDEPLTCDECSSILEDDLDSGDTYHAAAFPMQIYNPKNDHHFCTLTANGKARNNSYTPTTCKNPGMCSMLIWPSYTPPMER